MATASCSICGRTYNPGHSVSHSNRKTHRKWRPNLQRVRIKVGRSVVTTRVCARCIKGNRVQKA